MNEESIFVAALNLPPSRRSAFVAEACGDDQQLRKRIDVLLLAHKGDSWLDEPAYAVDEPLQVPEQIGRYRIRGTLGEGGFGLVYLAFDDQLERNVAIKVPHLQFFSSPREAAAQLAEARTVASLDHPNIVPVFDIGGDEDCPFYIVTKLIEGSDLATRLRQKPLRMDLAIELIAIVAQTLDYAHSRGIVHRDVKPGNILLDHVERPFLADFGLALRERDIGMGRRYAGSPAYMSPEQARGEGHRVDRRSDVFSLCIVLYEILAGQRPFHGETQSELLQHIAACQPRPIREHNRSISRELERVCLKGLAQRACDRYSTAKELAADLRHFLADAKPGALAERSIDVRRDLGTPTSSPGAQNEPLKIVPKGLRSFDKHDAEFFLGLLPGPRDRAGLPESIRFWKTRIESSEADDSFSVGVIYGPAGCGKSSMVKAGLIPRLSDRIAIVEIEASPSETESGLLSRLLRRFPDLPRDLGLTDVLSALRRGQGFATGGKVLLIIDQFEQWLHSRRNIQSAELVSALRQCDGETLSCLILVRDEFWLTLSRLMLALEIDIIPSNNAALVDLFDIDHGLQVLAAYGRAYGRLPEDGAKPSPEQQQLLRAAVAGLSSGDRVIPVRLAMFAEMMKGRPWTTKTLADVGGTKGIGVTLLEEAFGAPTADPRNRCHQDAIRAVLKTLLPESGSDIKGEMKSYDELLQVSGYERRPQDFVNLIRILDTEFRLITSINRGDNDPPEANEVSRNEASAFDADRSRLAEEAARPAEVAPSVRNYQLAHDYLVHSTRVWLSRKQRETRRGRAELLLTERASYWNEMRDPRFFPGWLDWGKISLLTRRRDWTASESRMMRAAGRHHCVRFSALFVIVAVVASLSLMANRQAKKQHADVLARELITALPDAVPSALTNLRPLGNLASATLERQMTDTTAHATHRLHAAFALADFGMPPHDYLLDAVSNTPARECSNLLRALHKLGANAIPGLRQRFDSSRDYKQRARLAIVMLHLGDSQPATDLLATDGDPLDRTTMIRTGAEWHSEIRVLVEAIRSNDVPPLRSGLCTMLGALEQESLIPEQRDSAAAFIKDLYLHDPDGGTHNAAGWALDRWEIDPPRIEPTARPAQGKGWFVNGQGITMLMIPAGSFSMRGRGGNEADVESSQEVTFSHARFIGDSEITVAQFQRFIDDADYPENEKPIDWPAKFARVTSASPTPDCPAHPINWFEAVLYCNWLSCQEGRQPAYSRVEGKQVLVDGSGNSHVCEKWRCNPATDGYRLPTEAEWEYASRAGSRGDFCCGSDSNSLEHYAWFSRNSKSRTWPAGILMPNAWGLYNTHGNLWEWCNDWYGEYASGAVVDPTGMDSGTHRTTRGGSFGDFSRSLSFAHRGYKHPYDGGIHGFRVVCREDVPSP